MQSLVDRPAAAPDRDAEDLFREARRRRRRRQYVTGGVAGLLAAGALTWSLTTGHSGYQPPTGGAGNALAGLVPAPTVPAGSKILAHRSLHQWRLRVYASSSGLAIAKVDTAYLLLDPQGVIRDSGTGTVGDSLAQTGVVHEGGGSGGGGPESWSVQNFQITLPDITEVRAVSGGKVLDSMTPVSFDGVRFVVLAVEGSPKKAVLAQGLDRAGAVVSSVPFEFPPAPRGASRFTGSVRVRPVSR